MADQGDLIRHLATRTARQRSGRVRHGGNAAGFMSFEFSIAGKWLELLKQIAPRVTQVVVLRDASQAFATSQFATMQAVAPPLGVEVIPVNMRNASEIEQSVESFALSRMEV